MKRTTVPLSLLLPFALLIVAAAPAPPPDAAEIAAAGKAAFSARCGICHGLDRALGKSKSAADWEATVSRMIGKAPGSITEGEKTSIVAYLTGKSLLEKSCANPACHGLERTEVGRIKTAWVSTVARMQKYARGKISDGDAALIAGYLSVERPAKP